MDQNLISIPYYIPGSDGSPATTTAFADVNTGLVYDNSGNPIIISGGDTSSPYQVSTDLVKDPIAVKMLQSGYVPYEGLQNVYIKPDSGQIAVSPNTSGIQQIYGGFAKGVDPQTGGVIIGNSLADSQAIVQRAVDYRNSIYTGGDLLSNILGTYAVPAMMSAFGGAAMGGMLPYEGAELAGLQASTTGLGTTAADAAAAQTALQGATLPSSLRTAISAGGQAITGTKPGDIAKSIGSQQAASALSNYAWGDTSGSTLSGLGKDITQYGLTYGLSNLLNKGNVQPTYELGGRTGQTQGAQTPSPSSSALAQVLKTDMGAPIFGGEKEGKPQKWGEGDLTGSSALREMGSGIV